MFRLLITVKDVPMSLILFTMMMEKIISSETSAATTLARRHIPEHGILPIINYFALILLDSILCYSKLGSERNLFLNITSTT
jgi:hypothetical protein